MNKRNPNLTYYQGYYPINSLVLLQYGDVTAYRPYHKTKIKYKLTNNWTHNTITTTYQRIPKVYTSQLNN